MEQLFSDPLEIAGCEHIIGHRVPTCLPGLPGMLGLISEAQEEITGPNPFNYEKFFLDMGALVDKVLDMSRNEWTNFEKLLYTKHTRYGAEPLTRWDSMGIVIRIDSKVSRLRNIMEQKALPTPDESQEDTLKDILGYCILGLIAIKKGMNRHEY